MAKPNPKSGTITEADIAHHRDSDRMNERCEMVASQIEARGIHNRSVLEALRRVERHRFVQPQDQEFAYRDGPLSIGQGQTMSQPYIVACMTEAIDPQPADRILEIGTGSGYQTAILAELVAEVFTIENIAGFVKRTEPVLAQFGYDNIHLKLGDGHYGWPEAAPFDKIIVTAAPTKLPKDLLDQLKPDGQMIVPIGRRHQELMLVRGTPFGFQEERLMPVRFVPMVNRLNMG